MDTNTPSPCGCPDTGQAIIAPLGGVITRLRSGLQSGRFTLTELAEATGIPLTTLADMRKDSYGDRLKDKLERLEKLKTALDGFEEAPV